MIGMEDFVEKLCKTLLPFTSEYFPSPKGIVFYGPPGTGKSLLAH
jgi:ATP-dependent 26S proteasome regulatory subunit